MKQEKLEDIMRMARDDYMIDGRSVVEMFDYFAGRIKEKNEVIERIRAVQLAMAFADQHSIYDALADGVKA